MFLKAPLGQAVLLAFIQAYGWLWIHVVALSFTADTLNGEAAGIGVIFLGWIWALVWGWVVCWPIARRVIGKPSVAGYLTSSVFLLPELLIIVWSSLIVMDLFKLHLNPKFLSACFRMLGLGVLPEGHIGFSGIHGFMFAGMFIWSLLGIYLTARKQIDASALLKNLIVTASLLAGSAGHIHAYDVPTHKTFLTERSAILLHKKSGQNYQELLDWKSNLMTGAESEDGGLNFVEHFYRPTDGAGLWIDPIRNPIRPTNNSALKRLLGQSPLSNLEPSGPFFSKAIDQYNAGHKSESYLLLGHALHLTTQDMFSPPHTHNDVHFNVSDKCYFGGLGLDPVCPWNRAQNSYEGWTSANFGSNTTDSRAAGTAVDPSAKILVPSAADVGSLLDHNAQSTYKAIRIQGSLNKNASNPASGALGAMFPVFDPATNPNGMIYEVGYSKWAALSGVHLPLHSWKIEGVGSMHEAEGGQGYSFTDHWWKADNFSANDPGEYYYLENPKTAFPRQYNGAATNGESLAELWIPILRRPQRQSTSPSWIGMV